MTSALSRLETAVGNIDQAGFFIGYAVSEADAANVSYATSEQGVGLPEESAAKRARLDHDSGETTSPVIDEVSAAIPSVSYADAIPDSNGGSPASSTHHHDDSCDPKIQQDSLPETYLEAKQADPALPPATTDSPPESNGQDLVNQTNAEPDLETAEAENVQLEEDDAVKSESTPVSTDALSPAAPVLLNSRREKEVYDSELMLNIHDSVNPLRTLDQFACGGRFVLNDTDRLVRVRFECGEKELKDAGSVCQLAVADLLRGHTKLSPTNPSQERGDHIAQDLAADFRISIHASANTKPADDATFLDEIRQRCCDVFNIPSLSLRRRHLRIYSKGGYCRPSMSSPRVPQRTIATVIVCLPSPFTGGKLVVSHLKTRKSFSFADRSASRDSVQWAAFYSDCEYEIKKVRSGHQALVIYDACVEGDEPMHRRQVYKHVITRAIPVMPFDEIASLVESVGSFLLNAPVVGLFTWYSYTLSALNKAPLTLKGLDRHIYDALSPRFRIVLLPVVVRLPYEDDASRNIRVAAFTRDDIEYMEGVADKPVHEELEPFEGVIPFPLRSDIETFEFCPNDEVEVTYFYSAMVIFPNVVTPIAEA